MDPAMQQAVNETSEGGDTSTTIVNGNSEVPTYEDQFPTLGNVYKLANYSQLRTSVLNTWSVGIGLG